MRVGTSRTSRRCTMAASLTGHRRHCARRASPLPSTCVSPDRARSQSHIPQKEGRKEFSRLSEGDAMDAGHTHVLRPTPTPTPPLSKHKNKSTCIRFKIVSPIQLVALGWLYSSFHGNYERDTRIPVPNAGAPILRPLLPWPWPAVGLRGHGSPEVSLLGHGGGRSHHRMRLLAPKPL